jgi:hypothetical protein
MISSSPACSRKKKILVLAATILQLEISTYK